MFLIKPEGVQRESYASESQSKEINWSQCFCREQSMLSAKRMILDSRQFRYFCIAVGTHQVEISKQGRGVKIFTF